MNIRRIMQTEVISLQADEPVINAVETVASERVRHLPVLEEDRLVGMVSLTDIRHATPSPLIDGNQEEYRKILTHTPVSRIMRCAPITASPESSLTHIVRLMVDYKIGAVPIVERGKLVGIVTELDVLKTFLRVLEVLE